jgi:NAD+ kinase
MTERSRHVLILAHTGRDATVDAAASALALLRSGGVVPVLTAQERDDLAKRCDVDGAAVLGDDVAVEDLELVVVLGGDGTILRAAELVRNSDVPLLGVNMGHVGFLAEAERDDLARVIARVIERRWDVEERRTVAVRVFQDDELVHEDRPAPPPTASPRAAR